MCERLIRLLRIAYDDNWAQFSDRLNYANSSGIQAIKKGRAFPEPQRLAMLSTWATEESFIPSINWIITGAGPALIRLESDQIAEGIALGELASRRAMNRKV